MAGEKTSPVLSIVTVFWNGRDDVPVFVRAMEETRRELPFSLEIIAIDNHSSDGTADRIAELAPWIRLIRNDKNIGFAPACNQGLEAARGTFLLLLNPDCEANADALRAMVAFLRRFPKAGAVGCTLLHGDGLPQHSYHHEPSWWSYWGTHSFASPLLLKLQKVLHKSNIGSRPFRVDWLMGACLMVPRGVYEEIGGLDPEYFMYSEDADWCRRIRDEGYAVVHLPGVSLTHHHGTSARRRAEFTFRRLYRSLLMYSGKHLGPMAGLLLRIVVIADLIIRVPVYALTGHFRRLESIRRVLAMFVVNDPGRFPE